MHGRAFEEGGQGNIFSGDSRDLGDGSTKRKEKSRRLSEEEKCEAPVCISRTELSGAGHGVWRGLLSYGDQPPSPNPNPTQPYLAPTNPTPPRPTSSQLSAKQTLLPELIIRPFPEISFCTPIWAVPPLLVCGGVGAQLAMGLSADGELCLKERKTATSLIPIATFQVFFLLTTYY